MLYLLFAIVLVVIQTILYFCHYFVYKTITKSFALENRKNILYLKILFGFLSTTFILTSLISSRYNNVFSRTFYNLTFLWIGFLFFFFFASLFFWIILYLGRKISFKPNPKMTASSLLILAIFLGIFSVSNADNIRIKNLSINLKNLPVSWQGKKAVWISDVHLGQIRGADFAQEIVQKINEINPEIVFVGGDLYDGAETNLDQVSQPFSKLTPSQGVYYVTGNHEEFDGNQKYLLSAQKVNMKVLNNEKVDVSGIQIVGVDYLDSTNREKYQKVLKDLQIDKERPSILLKHSPFYVEETEKAGISFQISGHSHGGQIYPMNYISKLIFYGYEEGLKKLGNLIVYTSTGTGTWGPPMRLGADPEIVVIDFENQ